MRGAQELASDDTHRTVCDLLPRIRNQHALRLVLMSQSLTIPPRLRIEAVRHCRWVDEIIPDAPWVVDEAFIQKVRVPQYLPLHTHTITCVTA